MRLLYHSFESPAANLALDEALLDDAESNDSGEVLRLWESPVHFVVLGLSQALEEHVYRESCAADGVPILRRCSAGGCVLQGLGCLNFSLVLRTNRPGCEGIQSSYRTILGLLAGMLAELGIRASLEGTSDLAVGGLKVSGNAQRRRRRYFLHHGTLLYGMDLDACGRYLREPAEQPAYRRGRGHGAFLQNLPIEIEVLREGVSRLFHGASGFGIDAPLLERMQSLARDKYESREWIERR